MDETRHRDICRARACSGIATQDNYNRGTDHHGRTNNHRRSDDHRDDDHNDHHHNDNDSNTTYDTVNRRLALVTACADF